MLHIRTSSRFPPPCIFRQRRLLGKKHTQFALRTVSRHPSTISVCGRKNSKSARTSGLGTGIGQSFARDARFLPLQDSSVDGILFSPPYSFAIDYLKNDSFHLEFLGADIGALRENMVGLRGRTPRQRFDFYKSDMERVLSECARVLRPGRCCTIVVGTNDNQIGKILGIQRAVSRG